MANIQDIWNALRDTEQTPYVLLDVAGFERGFEQVPKAAFAQIECLFTGDLAQELRDVAPYLGRVASFDNTTRDTLAELLNDHVATLVELADPAAITFSQLHRHFRKFNMVYSPEGNPLFFRYHDPRVLVDVLKAFDAVQRAAFFGPVARFTLFEREHGYVRCHCQGAELAVSA